MIILDGIERSILLQYILQPPIVQIILDGIESGIHIVLYIQNHIVIILDGIERKVCGNEYSFTLMIILDGIERTLGH